MRFITVKRVVLVAVLALLAGGAGIKVTDATHAGSARARVVQHSKISPPMSAGIPLLDG